MTADKKSEREARLAKALRENLKRRKEAARGAGEATSTPAKAGVQSDGDGKR